MTGVRTVAEGLFAQTAGVFDPSPGLAPAIELIERRCEFDLSKIAAPMKKQTGATRVKVRFSRLAEDVNAEVDPVGRPPVIEVNSSLRSESTEFIAVHALAETAHLVDHYLLTREQRKAIFKLFKGGDDPWFSDDEEPHAPKGAPHDAAPRGKHASFASKAAAPDGYFDQVGESFMGGFIFAWTDFKVPSDLTTLFKHTPTPAIGRGIRKIMGG